MGATCCSQHSLGSMLDAYSPAGPGFIPKIESVLSIPCLSSITLFLSCSPTTSSFPVCKPCQHCLGSGCAVGDPSWAEGWIPAQRARRGLFFTSEEPGSRERQH